MINQQTNNMDIIKKLILSLVLMSAMAASAANTVEFKVNQTTGAIDSIGVSGDANHMNWVLRTNQSQYKWVSPNYGWGLGYLSVNGVKHGWNRPSSIKKGGMKVSYMAGGIRIDVARAYSKGMLTERYTFTNTTGKAVHLSEIGIYTPFNDNYPTSQTCMTNRCHAGIWPGGDYAYVMASKMSGRGAGLGLMTTENGFTAYDVWERAQDHAYSNFRGVIALSPADCMLLKGGSVSMAWKLFAHNGTNDFYKRMVALGGAVMSSDKYVYEVGETAKLTLTTAKGTSTKKVRITKPGEVKVEMVNGNKSTYAELLGVSSYYGLMQKRVSFILDHQQIIDPTSPRYGAYMVYDNELNKIYMNDGARRSNDTGDGRERIGMGILLAKWQMLHPSDRLKESLVRYATFVRNKLQKADYTTKQTSDGLWKDRGYNYPWAADFYLYMYDVTKDKTYAQHAYGTMKALFRRFHYGFYCINIPVLHSVKVLREAGMTAQADSLMASYKKTADIFIKNGLNFPHHEVNYEQSIIAPATQFMCEMYLETHDSRCLEMVRLFLPALEAFAAEQPSCHLNDIAIRHWDGYWFGKKRLWGDTFPHYWSAINANVFHYYAQITGDKHYQERAENIVRNNLCNFFENGKASCAFIYPRLVNGEKAHCYDPFANDQDWTLAYYLLVDKGI